MIHRNSCTKCDKFGRIIRGIGGALFLLGVGERLRRSGCPKISPDTEKLGKVLDEQPAEDHKSLLKNECQSILASLATIE